MRKLTSYLSDWRNLAGLAMCLSFVLVALAAPLLSAPDPQLPEAYKRAGRITDLTPHPPGPQAPLGTVPQQLSVYHTLIWGTRDALRFGLIVVVSTLFFGVFYGALAGLAGGAVNNLMMRIADAFMSFPVLASIVFMQVLVAISLNALTTTVSSFQWMNGIYPVTGSNPLTIFFSQVDPLLLSLILFSWMSYARLTNARVLTLKQEEFVQASRALGGGNLWITFKHLIPNAIGPSIVLASRDMGNAVILQATLTTLRLGSSSPWGIMLATGRDWVIGPGASIFSYWWVYIPITLAIILFGISWNLLGDQINEYLNPTRTRPFREPTSP